MESVIRGATAGDIEQLVEMRSSFTFEDGLQSDESIPFYRRHGFDAPADPLIWEPTKQ